MSNKTKNIIGSLIAIIISGVCAYAGATTNLIGIMIWFGTLSVTLGLFGIASLITTLLD